MRQAKAFTWGRCETCSGAGWLLLEGERSDCWEGDVAVTRCEACDGRGERMHERELPVTWPPCEVCGYRCESQLEGMEANGGHPHARCSGCDPHEPPYQQEGRGA
jgi:hypothetical protein